MKLKIDVECSPQEARAFLGLPDVEPIQKAMMKQMEEKMASALGLLEPETLARQWAPIGIQSLEQFQKMFLRAAGMASTAKSDTSDKK